MRINAYLASASKLSRRAADAAVMAGRVTINDELAKLGTDVNENDHVTLDGKLVRPNTRLSYIAYHKPAGLVVSRTAQRGNQTIYNALPTHLHHLQPIGRLDKDSSGLLLLTNDGQFANRAAHPSFGKRKVYEVTLDSPIAPDHVIELERGVELDDGPSRVHVIASSSKDLTLELEEGRNRQIRRTLEALGYHVVRLHRVKFGALELGTLEPDAWREFRPEELL